MTVSQQFLWQYNQRHRASVLWMDRLLLPAAAGFAVQHPDDVSLMTLQGPHSAADTDTQLIAHGCFRTLFLSSFSRCCARYLLLVPAAAGFAVQHPDDVSLMTYRGHAVLQTLIRSYFSPAHSTGQRYIYAGNAEGDILVWDVVSGKLVSWLFGCLVPVGMIDSARCALV
jgi:hypothetical protein